MLSSTKIATAILLLTILVGCSTRSAPCDVVGTTGDKLVNRDDLRNTNTDIVPGVAIADSDGEAIAAPTTATVETQTNNNNDAPQLTVHDLFGLERQVANVLGTTMPGEALTLRNMERIEMRLNAIQTRLDTDPALTSTDRAELKAQITDLEGSLGAVRLQLDQYAERKVAMAKELAPKLELPALERIVAFVVSNNNAGTDRSITDAQAESIKDAVKGAFERKPVGQ